MKYQNCNTDEDIKSIASSYIETQKTIDEAKFCPLICKNCITTNCAFYRSYSFVALMADGSIPDAMRCEYPVVFKNNKEENN